MTAHGESPRVAASGKTDIPHAITRTDNSVLLDILKTARPKQWLKNAFVLAALLFASKLDEPAALAESVAAFWLFCLLSASAYILNDAADATADRLHPLKRNRPIAAGRLPRGLAVAIGVVAASVGVGLSVLLDARFGVIAVAYLALTGTYTVYLKHQVLLDVFAIAAGFVLRAAGGAQVIHVTVSPWLYLCTIFLALFLGFGKRRHELLLLATEAHTHRRNLEHYTAPLLDDLINITASASIIAYSLYTFFATAVPRNHAMMITIPFVPYGVFRYLLIIARTDVAGAPEEAVWRDTPLLVNLILWAGTAAAAIHFR